MSRSLPPLNALRAFEVAARHLSFRQAAEELHVTPAAISHQIKALESYLGVRLFHRLNKGLALTDPALAGLSSLREGFDKLTEAVASMQGKDGLLDLAVEAAPSFATKWLVPRLPRFGRHDPDVELRIAANLDLVDGASAASDVRANFRDGEVDVAIRFGHGNYPRCRVDLLFDVAVVPLCSPTLLEGAHPLTSPENLAHHTLLHDDTPYEDHPDWSVWLKAAGVSDIPMKRGLHFNQVSMALQSAIDGQGIVLSLDALAVDDIEAGRLVVPFSFRLPLGSSYYVISLQESAEIPRIKAFREWLLREAQTFIELRTSMLGGVAATN
jgi:LysR family glycine cleavage system transcriptional activator